MHDATPWTISAGREAKSARRPTSTEGAMSLKQSVTHSTSEIARFPIP